MRRTNSTTILFLIFLLLGCNVYSQEDNIESFQRLIKLPLREGNHDSFLSLMRINIQESRKEEGNIYTALFGNKNENTVYFLERYKNKEAWEKHEETVYARSTNAIAPEATLHLMEETVLKEIAEIPTKKIKNASAEGDTPTIIFRFHIKPEKRAQFLEIIKKKINEARDAEGNLGFNIYQTNEDSAEFIMIESWNNKQAYQAYLENDLVKSTNRKMEPIFSENSNRDKIILNNISE